METFKNKFLSATSMLSAILVQFSDGNSDFIGRRVGDEVIAVNFQLLYRIASRESLKDAIDFFISDQLIEDANTGMVPVRRFPFAERKVA